VAALSGRARAGASLVFVGFMGAGKSRALRRLGEQERDGVDTDALLESELGMPIAEFFARQG
jgi:shikimate kinase